MKNKFSEIAAAILLLFASMLFLGCPGSGGNGITPPEKNVTVGAQSGALTQGTFGTVTFTVTTENIAGLVPVDVANLPAGINASQVMNIINNSGTLALSGNAAEGVYNNLTLTIEGAKSDAFTLTVLGVTAGAKTIEVGVQTGTLQATMAQTVTFTVITTNIPSESYDPIVNKLPEGVYALGRVTITANGSGTLSLLGYPDSVQGVYDDLTLTLEGIDGVTSNEFTLTVAEAPEYQIQDYDPYEMVLINGGTFTMGSPDDEPGRVDNEIQHEVTLGGFYMGRYQVTRAMWIAVTGEDPAGAFPNHTSEVDADAYLSYPVEHINWYAAVKFCNTLSIHEGLTPAYRIMGNTDPGAWGPVSLAWDEAEIVEGSAGYRLPTEAQWEYACRAGTTAGFNWGSNYITDDNANYVSAVDPTNLTKGNWKNWPTVVGSYDPNAWGLYDMHGNVWEWCWDWYGAYPEEPQTDPTGPETGALRTLRGGSCWDLGKWARSASRNEGQGRSPNMLDVIGLRMVRPIGGEQHEK